MSRLQIHFRLGSIPVRIEPGFWLVTVLLGSRYASVLVLGLWIVLELIAVLVHELGHALAARAFGAKPDIVLHSMGGLTRYAVPRGRAYGRLPSMAISFAGPLAGFLFAAATVLAAALVAPGGGSLVDRALSVYQLVRNPTIDNVPSLVLAFTVGINVIWGAFNLLPILPLDGGNIVRALLSGASPESGTVRALWVSAVVGPAMALGLYELGMPLAAMLFGYFAVMSIRQLIDARKIDADRRSGLQARLDDAQEAISAGDFDRAEAQATAAFELASSPIVRRTAVHILAVGRLERGDARSALDMLRNLPDNETDPFLLGATLLACGRAEDAIPHLERATRSGGQRAAQELLERARKVAQAWNSGSQADRASDHPGDS